MLHGLVHFGFFHFWLFFVSLLWVWFVKVKHFVLQGNPIHALGQSISFGRFMSESLSWEKWSTFPHKKYVEEAERYSRPGSVAEKKAFFEAHYKKIAERKAAALLEQAQNDASKNVPESESVDGVNNVTTQDTRTTPFNSQPEVKANEYNEGNKVEAADFVNENKVLVEKNVNVESTKQIGNDNNKVEALSQLGVDDKATQMGKPQLKVTMLTAIEFSFSGSVTNFFFFL